MSQIMNGTRQMRMIPVPSTPETRLLTPSAITTQMASQPST